jgi:hypothetical protein
VPRVNKNGRIFKIFLRHPPKKEGTLRRFNIALTGPCWQQTPFCDKIHTDNEKERKKKIEGTVLRQKRKENHQ